MGMYYEGGGGSHSTQGPPSYRVWGGGEGASTHPCPTYNQMHAGFSFSYSPISVSEAASFDKKELRRSCTGIVLELFGLLGFVSGIRLSLIESYLLNFSLIFYLSFRLRYGKLRCPIFPTHIAF
jgi:hypothetical protein